MGVQQPLHDFDETQTSFAVCNIRGPGIDGIEVCKRVRERNDEDAFYILLLTGRTAEEDIVQALEAGANDYISKPFNNVELKARLKNGRKLVSLKNKLLHANQQLEKYRNATG